MKARLPKAPGGIGNIQKLAQQAQKMQEKMDEATEQLNSKTYIASSGGEAVKVVVTGKMEVQSIEMKPEIIVSDYVEMLSVLLIAATNEALRSANEDKKNTMEKISGSINMPNIPGMF